jgi:hypothetical protein
VQSDNVAPIFVLNRVVFGFFFGSCCLIATVLKRVTKKINRAQSGFSREALWATVGGAELQKMEYGEYQILKVPIHLPIGVNGWGGLKLYHNIVFKIDNNT